MTYCALSFNRKMALQVVQGHQKADSYVVMLQWVSLLTEGPCLCGNDFQQDIATVQIASLMKISSRSITSLF